MKFLKFFVFIYFLLSSSAILGDDASDWLKKEIDILKTVKAKTWTFVGGKNTKND